MPKGKAQAEQVNPAEILSDAFADYQAEVAGDFAAAELEVAKGEYQAAMSAEFDRLTSPAQAAEVAVKAKKVRASYPDAAGKSPNGFSMRMITGQIDACMEAYKAQNGTYPSAAAVAALIHADAKRVQGHISWWQSPANTPHRGRGPFYLG